MNRTRQQKITEGLPHASRVADMREMRLLLQSGADVHWTEPVCIFFIFFFIICSYQETF